jgi:hypothetical protein
LYNIGIAGKNIVLNKYAKEIPFNLLSIIFTSSANIVKKKNTIMQWKYHTIYSTIVLLAVMLTVICRQNILRTITIKEVLILVTNILDQIVLKV